MEHTPTPENVLAWALRCTLNAMLALQDRDDPDRRRTATLWVARATTIIENLDRRELPPAALHARFAAAHVVLEEALAELRRDLDAPIRNEVSGGSTDDLRGADGLRDQSHS